MRIVDEIPEAGHRQGKYDYDKIDELVQDMKIVALDAAEYDAQPNSIRSNIQRHIDRHGRPWRVTTRGQTVYVSPGPELYGPQGALGR